MASLIVVTVVWGASFVVVKDVIERVAPMDFLAVRFLLAAGVLALWSPRRLRVLSRRRCGHGVLAGILLSGGFIGLTIGQQYLSVSESGFMLGLSVVFTPIIAGVLLRQRIGPAIWRAVVLATVGLALMTMHGAALGAGEALTLLCAFCFAAHVVALGEWSTEDDAYALTVIQLGVVGVLCLGLGAVDGIELPSDPGFWLPVAGLAVVATAGAFLVQTWAQAQVPAVVVALALTMEPVFAGVFGVLVDNDELTVRIVLGAMLVAGAMALTAVSTSTSTSTSTPEPAPRCGVS